MKGIRVYCSNNGTPLTFDYVMPLTAKVSAIRKQFLLRYPDYQIDRVEIMPVGDVRVRAVT